MIVIKKGVCVCVAGRWRDIIKCFRGRNYLWTIQGVIRSNCCLLSCIIISPRCVPSHPPSLEMLCLRVQQSWNQTSGISQGLVDRLREREVLLLMYNSFLVPFLWKLPFLLSRSHPLSTQRITVWHNFWRWVLIRDYCCTYRSTWFCG